MHPHNRPELIVDDLVFDAATINDGTLGVDTEQQEPIGNDALRRRIREYFDRYFTRRAQDELSSRAHQAERVDLGRLYHLEFRMSDFEIKPHCRNECDDSVDLIDEQNGALDAFLNSFTITE